MINLNDEKIRQELVGRYLNAETTLEEERLLADFLSNADIALSAEEEDILLMLKASDFIGQTDISEEKAEEFDRLMVARPKQTGKTLSLYWLFPAAAAAIIAFVFLMNGHESEIKEENPVAMIALDAIPSEEEAKEEIEAFPKGVNEDDIKAIHNHATNRPNKEACRHRRPQKNSGQRIADMTKAANFQDEQVESYQLRPAGDATIVTKTYSDGTSSSYIICASDDGDGYRVVPMIDM